SFLLVEGMERPGTACVAPFKIDQYEVTNAQYLAFWNSLSDSERNDRRVRANLYPAAWAETEPPFPGEIKDLPVLGVSRDGAEAFAKSRGTRLPTAYEWVLAAFGHLGELNPPEWVTQYMADRRETFLRVRAAHVQYVASHPELQRRTS